MKKFWAGFCIALSYFFTYFAPIILMYYVLQDTFAKQYVTESRYSLTFLGFVTVSAVLIIALMIKLGFQLRKAKPSIFKFAMQGLMNIVVVLFVIFVIVKLYNFTFVIESDTMTFIHTFRSFTFTAKNYMIIFACCLGLSKISNIVALIIDKEFVRSIEWL